MNAQKLEQISAKYYAENAKSWDTSRKNLKWDEFDIAAKFLPKNAKILDLGCGNARFREFLAAKNINFKKFVGADLSRGLIDICRTKFPDNDWICNDMRSFAQNCTEKYDFVVCFAAFHHLADKKLEFLENIHDLLTDDGVFIMTNWKINAEHLKNKDIVEKDKNVIIRGENERFYHRFSAEDLQNLCKKAELNSETRETHGNFITIAKK